MKITLTILYHKKSKNKIKEKVKIRKDIITIIILLNCIVTQIMFPLSICLGKKAQTIYKIPTTKITKTTKETWKIEIPKINLKAEIKDGTDQENLNKNIGHFVESGYINGNICLAAHNRGYKVNYFQNLKQLEKGDKIIYKYKDIELVYIVDTKKIIKDTDIQVIKPTKENKITLITCVENQPEYRRCIQGKLKI